MNSIPIRIVKLGNGSIGKVFIRGQEADRLKSEESTRKIFLWKDYIIKFDNKSGPYWYDYQCWFEVHNWVNRIPEEHKECFAPLIDFGTVDGFPYVVQKFLKRDNNRDDMPDDLWELIHETIGIRDIQQYPGANWHWHDGKPIVYDYASFSGVVDFFTEKSSKEMRVFPSLTA